MRGFVKATTIRGVLQRNHCTLAEAKMAARDMEHIERDYESFNSSLSYLRREWTRLGRLIALHVSPLKRPQFP